jgi:hypothetical protein
MMMRKDGMGEVKVFLFQEVRFLVLVMKGGMRGVL